MQAEIKDTESLRPKCSDIQYPGTKQIKHVSVKDDKTLSNLDSKLEDSSVEDDEEEGKQ